MKWTNYNQRIAEALGGSIYGIKLFANVIRLGSVAYKNTEVLIPTKNTYLLESLKIEKHGSIGGKLFEKSTIVIDYISGFVFIEKHEESSKVSNHPMAIINNL